MAPQAHSSSIKLRQSPQRVWVSDCGQFYAIEAPGRFPSYDVVEIDGTGVWLNIRYVPTGFADLHPYYRCCEFPRIITSWSNLEKRLRSGRYVDAFGMSFCDVRQDLEWQRISDDTPYHVLRYYEAKFHRKCPISRRAWKRIQERIQNAIDGGHCYA